MKKRFFLIISLLLTITLTSCDISLGSLIGSSNINYNSSSISSNNASSVGGINSNSITSSSSNLIDSSSCVCDYYVDEDLDVLEFQDLLLATRDKARNANVIVQVNYYRKFGPVTELVGTSTGSGAVYKKDSSYYYAITNFHVVENINEYPLYQIKISTMSGDVVIASIVNYDSNIDLAVVKFAATGLKNINIYDVNVRKNAPLNEGEFVLAIGNPSAIEGNVTFGEFVKMTKIANVDYEVIEHTALIYSGNSGGALVDIYGNLVGINTWGAEGEPYESFSIPLSKVIEFLTNNKLL